MIVRPRILYKILTSNRKVLTENNFPELCRMIPFRQPTFLATPGEQNHPTGSRLSFIWKLCLV